MQLFFDCYGWLYIRINGKSHWIGSINSGTFAHWTLYERKDLRIKLAQGLCHTESGARKALKREAEKQLRILHAGA